MNAAAALMLLAIAGPVAAQAPERYTPVEVWRNADEAKYREAWFGEHLAAMRAPRLVPDTAMKGHVERVRLLVLPSFDRPYTVMIDRHRDGRATMRFVMTDGRGGYGGGKIVDDRTRPLTPTEWQTIATTMAAARLADRVTDSRPSDSEFRGEAPPAQSGVGCMDGTQLVIERRTAAGYRIVTRHECRIDTSMRGLIDAVVGLTGETPRDGYVIARPRGT